MIEDSLPIFSNRTVLLGEVLSMTLDSLVNSLSVSISYGMSLFQLFSSLNRGLAGTVQVSLVVGVHYLTLTASWDLLAILDLCGYLLIAERQTSLPTCCSFACNLFDIWNTIPTIWISSRLLRHLILIYRVPHLHECVFRLCKVIVGQ